MAASMNHGATYLRDEPVRLIAFPGTEDEGAQVAFAVTDEGRELFAALPPGARLHVVSIAGPARKGKSYLLTRVFKEQKGFKLGSLTMSETRGVWCWIRPFPGGSELDFAILLDTEGVDAVPTHESEMADRTRDMKIFVLAMMLASVFIYNTDGALDETAVDRLAFALRLSEHVRAKTTGSEDEQLTALRDMYPFFFWVVRDFSLTLEIEGVPVTANEYLNRVLEPQATANTLSQAVHNADRLRRMINMYLQPARRMCHVLPRPVVDEATLRTVDEQPYDSLRPEFRAALEPLVDDILMQARGTPFSLDLETRRPLGPAEYIEFAAGLVDAFNNGTVPTISSLLDQVTRLTCQKGMDAALAGYRASMGAVASPGSHAGGPFPISLDAFVNAHEAFTLAALATFNEHVVNASGTRDEYYAALELALRGSADVRGLYHEFADANAEASSNMCKQMLEDLYAPIHADLLAGAFSPPDGEFEAYNTRVNAAWLQYNAEAVGPAREAELDAFIRGTVHNEREILLGQNAHLGEAVLARERAQAQADEEAARALAAEQERAQVEAEMQEAARAHTAELELQRQEMAAALQAEIDEQRTELEKMWAERESAIRERNDRDKAMWEARINDQNKALDDIRTQHKAEMDRREGEISKLRSRCEQLASQPPQPIVVESGGCSIM